MPSSSTGSVNSSGAEPRSRQPGPQRILLAAEKVFVRDGVEGARMDAIASEAGMARSHLYYHYKNKEDMFAALVELRTADLLASKAALFDAWEAEGPGEREQLLRAAIASVLEPHRDFLRLMITEAIRRPELPAELTCLVHEVLADTRRRLGWKDAHDPRTVELFYLLIAPALLGVVLPADPTGLLEGPADLAPYLERASAWLTPPASPGA